MFERERREREDRERDIQARETHTSTGCLLFSHMTTPCPPTDRVGDRELNLGTPHDMEPGNPPPSATSCPVFTLNLILPRCSSFGEHTLTFQAGTLGLEPSPRLAPSFHLLPSWQGPHLSLAQPPPSPLSPQQGHNPLSLPPPLLPRTPVADRGSGGGGRDRVRVLPLAWQSPWSSYVFFWRGWAFETASRELGGSIDMGCPLVPFPLSSLPFFFPWLRVTRRHRANGSAGGRPLSLGGGAPRLLIGTQFRTR